jgi:hypothetical protein
MILLILLFNAWSIANIIVHGSIFSGARKFLLLNSPFWGSMVTCMMCASVYVGLAQALILNFSDVLIIFPDNPWLDIFILTFCSSGFSYIADMIIWKFFISDKI